MDGLFEFSIRHLLKQRNGTENGKNDYYSHGKPGYGQA